MNRNRMRNKLRTAHLAVGLAIVLSWGVAHADVALEPSYAEPKLEIVVAGGGETALADWLTANGRSLDGVKTLVKRGAGTLRSTTDISSAFDGDIVIAEGVFAATAVGALGGANGAVYVLSGAQYQADARGVASFNLQDKPLVVAGTGPTGDGALRYLGDKYQTTALGDIYLADDALLAGPSREDLCFSKSIRFNGKTLTMRLTNRLIAIGPFVGPGTFESVNAFQRGGAAVFTNGVELLFGATTRGEIQTWGASGYSAGGVLHVGAKGGKWLLAGKTKQTTRHNRWDGTIQLDGPLALTKYAYSETSADYASDESVVLAGKVSGVGSLTSGGQTVDDPRDGGTHLYLLNGENDFTGGVAKTGGSVNLFADGALPADGGALVLSNAVVRLDGDDAWTLPELHVCGTGLVQTATAVKPDVVADPLNPPLARGQWKRIVKEGAGKLVVSSAYETPCLDVRAGSVTLAVSETNALGLSGLVAGYTNFATEVEMTAAFRSEELYATGIVNRVTVSDTLPDKNGQFPGNSFWTYSGFLWNRTGETQTWTFLLKQEAATKLWLDGSLILEQEGAIPKIVRQTVAPGAHRFVLRMGKANGWAGTSAAMVDWSDRMMGFCIDFNGGDAPPTKVNEKGETHYDFSAYTRPMDDGTGALFTLTDRSSPCGQLTYATLRGLPGAVVDAQGADQTAEELVGYPTVWNGGLTVGARHRLEGGVAVGCAHVEGTLTFDEGCAFEVDDAKALRVRVREAGKTFPLVIAEAEKIVGCPVPADGTWALTVDATGTKLLLDRKGPGCLLLVR